MANVTVYVVTSWSNLPSQSSPLEATALNHIEIGIKNVTDFVNLLNTNNNTYYVLSQTAFTNALKSKLDGIEANANNYSLPTASTTTLGGVKIDGTTITIENGVIRSTTSGVSTLAGLTDVDLDNLEDGQILKWDSTEEKWVNSSEAEVRTQLSLLEDVDIDDTSLADGQVLKYNGTTEKWENGEGGGSGEVLDYDETLDVLGLPANPLYRYKIATPVMTSNTTPSGIASASSEFNSARAAWKAFAQDITINEYNAWCTNNETTGAWLKYDFGNESKCITRLDTYNRADALGVVTEFKFQGSNDGTTWTDLETCTATNLTATGLNSYTINNNNSYSKYRILVQSVNTGTTTVSFTCVNMYEKYLA